MTGNRRPEEVVVVVRRPGESGIEFLVVLRSPEKLGYWHLIAGGVDWGEEPAAAAARELREETGLEAPVFLLGETLDYDLAGDPESVRERFAEFATLKTIGFSDRAVTAMVVLESALPCVLGAVLGVGLAAVLARQIPKLMPPTFSMPMPTMSPAVMLWAAAAALAVAALSAALPVLRLRQMDIASALSGRA